MSRKNLHINSVIILYKDGKRTAYTVSRLHGRQKINSFIVKIEILNATTGSRLQSRQKINSFIVKIEILKATTGSRLQSRQRINSFIVQIEILKATTASRLQGSLQSRQKSNSFIDILKDSFIKKDQLPIKMDLILRPSNCVVQ